QSVAVSGAFPVTGKIYSLYPAVLFGPITGDGRNITFSNCFSGNTDWDSFLELNQAPSAADLYYCGGTVNWSVDFNNQANPICPFGSALSRLTQTLTTGVTYWLPSGNARITMSCCNHQQRGQPKHHTTMAPALAVEVC
ncbi:hypothetical protein HaLaN_26315, partial [Haematococcus lacustris]